MGFISLMILDNTSEKFETFFESYNVTKLF